MSSLHFDSNPCEPPFVDIGYVYSRNLVWLIVYRGADPDLSLVKGRITYNIIPFVGNL